MMEKVPICNCCLCQCFKKQVTRFEASFTRGQYIYVYKQARRKAFTSGEVIRARVKYFGHTHTKRHSAYACKHYVCNSSILSEDIVIQHQLLRVHVMPLASAFPGPGPVCTRVLHYAIYAAIDIAADIQYGYAVALLKGRLGDQKWGSWSRPSWSPSPTALI